MTQKPNVALALTLGSVILLFGGLLVAMGRMGFFSFRGDDPTSKVVAASLALVGAFVGAAVSIVGTVVKYSIDQQTAAQNKEAEQRLGLEAAVKALQLFSTSSGSLTPAIQREGALFMLANFDQHELTLQLVDELLAKGDLSLGAAASVINQALKNGNEDQKISAIDVLYAHAAQMASPSGIYIPECIEKCDVTFSAYVREWVVIALGEVMLGMPVTDWAGTPKCIFRANSVLSVLGIAWTMETDERLKNNTGAILHPILSAFPEVGILNHPRMTINTEPIRNEVATLAPYGDAAEELVKRLTQWAFSRGASGVAGPTKA